MEEPMKRSAALFLIGLMIVCSACSYSSRSRQADIASAPSPPQVEDAPAAPSSVDFKSAGDVMPQTSPAVKLNSQARIVPHKSQAGGENLLQVVPLDSAGAAQAFMRKVIQNAEMTIETDKPNEGQQKIGVIAEKHGGFVVISESKHNEAASQNVAST